MSFFLCLFAFCSLIIPADPYKRPYRRKFISLDKKIQILDRFKNGDGSTAIARQFGLNESTIRTIKKNEEKIRASVSTGSSRRRVYARKIAVEKMEQELLIWIKEQFHKNVSVVSNAIRKKALEIFHKIQTNEPTSNKNASFVASNGWLDTFKTRYCFPLVARNQNVSKRRKRYAKIQKPIVPQFKPDGTGVFWN